MPNDADSLTESDVDEPDADLAPQTETEPDVEDELSTADAEVAGPTLDADAQVAPGESVQSTDSTGEDPDATGQFDTLVTLEDIHGDEAEDLLDPDDPAGDDDDRDHGAYADDDYDDGDEFYDDLVTLEDLGHDPDAEFAPDGALLFDGDPEEFELDLGVPYPDGRPQQGDLVVLDEPTGSLAPPARRMSRMERRRRVRLQARRVRRIVRHVEPWSVLKISIFFYACLWVIFLVAGFMIWGVAESSGTVDKLENLIRDLFALETFDFDAGQIFRGYALGGLALSIAGTTFNVLMCLLFNLISDLTGGLRITMIEEETARPAPPRRRRRRPPPRR